MSDIVQQINSVSRQVGSRAIEAGAARTVTISQTYQASLEDLWDATVWVEADLGWATEWRIDWQGRSHRWQRRGITFDDAFRQGIGGAAQVLSGNGDPAT